MIKSNPGGIPLTDLLENLVDDVSLDYLLSALAQVCYAKADHVLSNWQDQKLSKTWERCGVACDRAADQATQGGL